MKPSEAQLDLAAGVRARAEGETTADQGAQVLARLREHCRTEPGGAQPVRTVRPQCLLSPELRRQCYREKRPFPDPHRWKEESLGPFTGWMRCTRCGEWTRKDDS